MYCRYTRLIIFNSGKSFGTRKMLRKKKIKTVEEDPLSLPWFVKCFVIMYTFVQCRNTQVSERKIWEAGSQFEKWNLSEQASNFCDTNFAKIESHSPTCLNEFHRLSCLNVIWYRPLPLCYTFVFVGFYGSNIIRISLLRTTFSKTKHTYTREKTEKKNHLDKVRYDALLMPNSF